MTLIDFLFLWELFYLYLNSITTHEKEFSKQSSNSLYMIKFKLGKTAKNKGKNTNKW